MADAGFRRFSQEPPPELRLVVLLVFSKVELARDEVELEVLRLRVLPFVPLEVWWWPLVAVSEALPLLVLPVSNWFLSAFTDGRNFFTFDGLFWLLSLPEPEFQFLMST